MNISNQEVNIRLFQYKIHDILYEWPEQRNVGEEDEYIDRRIVRFTNHRGVERDTECCRPVGWPRRRVIEKWRLGVIECVDLFRLAQER